MNTKIVLMVRGDHLEMKVPGSFLSSSEDRNYVIGKLFLQWEII